MSRDGSRLPPPLLDAMRRIDGLLQQGEFRSAQAQLETVIRDHPEFVEAQRLLAGTRLASGDPAGAEALLRHAMSIAPDWTPTLTMLGELLLNARRRHADALAVAAPFCAAGKAAPELVTQHVTALIALGRTEEAVAFYRRIADGTPDDPAAAHGLAIALQAAGSQAEAEQTAHRLLSRGYQSASLGYTHARSLIALGELERAEAALRGCLQRDPQHADAHGDLARLVWIRTGDAARATAALDEALRRFPGNDALWAVKAAVVQGAGDPRAAYACLAPRIERPHAPPALLLRAGLAALEFDPAIALDLGASTMRRLPGDAASMKLMA